MTEIENDPENLIAVDVNIFVVFQHMYDAYWSDGRKVYSFERGSQDARSCTIKAAKFDVENFNIDDMIEGTKITRMLSIDLILEKFQEFFFERLSKEDISITLDDVRESLTMDQIMSGVYEVKET